MPCCGLHEYRESVPVKYTLAGIVVFWGTFAAGLLAGVLTAWSRWGRHLLACQWQFMRSLWRETMQDPGSVPARWNCRLSGRILPLSPAIAGAVYRRPWIPLLLFVGVSAGVLVGGVFLISRLT